jgi:protease-4
MTAEERAYLQAVIDDLHQRFREVVREGRPGLDEARVQELSDGRIFTATQAEQAGLVDGIGYLPGAIDEVERRVGASEVRVVTYHREREWRSNIYSTAPAAPSSQASPAARLGLGGGPAFLYLWWPGGL